MEAYPEERYPLKDLTDKIIGAAFEVHRNLGHSFVEKVYENALVRELKQRGMHVVPQFPLRVNYGGEPVGSFTADILVEDKIIVELKAVQTLEKSSEEKLVHYLKASGLTVGLLINFGRSVTIKRRINTSKNSSAKSVISASSAKSVKIQHGDPGAEFIKTARTHLVKEYLPKFRECINQLTDDEVWWRAHETDNSVGNLLLHLTGNLNQWILAGLGGTEYVRDRPKEFSERRHIPKAELWKHFEETVLAVDQVLERFDVNKLTEIRHFQKWDHTCLFAIFHVVEHLGQHMGQIIYITKLKQGVDLRFFRL